MTCTTRTIRTYVPYSYLFPEIVPLKNSLHWKSLYFFFFNILLDFFFHIDLLLLK
jgi:hypothetical protein